jgi:hypothetical protein
MKCISGTQLDIDKIKGYEVLEFKILETVYDCGKIYIKSWEAKVKEETKELNYPKPYGRGKAQVLLSQLQIKETEDHLKMVMGEEYYEIN